MGKLKAEIRATPGWRESLLGDRKLVPQGANLTVVGVTHCLNPETSELVWRD